MISTDLPAWIEELVAAAAALGYRIVAIDLSARPRLVLERDEVRLEITSLELSGELLRRTILGEPRPMLRPL